MDLEIHSAGHGITGALFTWGFWRGSRRLGLRADRRRIHDAIEAAVENRPLERASPIICSAPVTGKSFFIGAFWKFVSAAAVGPLREEVPAETFQAALRRLRSAGVIERLVKAFRLSIEAISNTQPWALARPRRSVVQRLEASRVLETFRRWQSRMLLPSVCPGVSFLPFMRMTSMTDEPAALDDRFVARCSIHVHSVQFEAHHEAQDHPSRSEAADSFCAGAAAARSVSKRLPRKRNSSSDVTGTKSEPDTVRPPPRPEDLVEWINARADCRTRTILAVLLVSVAVIALPLVAALGGSNAAMMAWGIIGPVLSAILTYYFVNREKQKPKSNPPPPPERSD